MAGSSATTTSPDRAMSERARLDERFIERPAIELVERSDRAIPGRGGNALLHGATPPRPMIGRNVITISTPDRLAARLIKKPRPDHDVIAIGAQCVARTGAIGRQVAKKTVQRGVVEGAVFENDGNVTIAARTSLLQRDHCSQLVHISTAGHLQTLPRTPSRSLNQPSQSLAARRPPRRPPPAS